MRDEQSQADAPPHSVGPNMGPIEAANKMSEAKSAVDWCWRVHHLGVDRIAMALSIEHAISLLNSAYGDDPTATGGVNCEPPRRWNEVVIEEDGQAVARPWMGKTREGIR